MAATTAIVRRGASGDLFERVVDITLDANYPAGGYALTPQQLGFGLNGQIVLADAVSSKTGGWEVGWDYTNSKLQVFDSSGAASAAMHEAAGGTVLTGVVVRALFKGIGNG
jgi:hypothetical protein